MRWRRGAGAILAAVLIAISGSTLHARDQRGESWRTVTLADLVPDDRLLWTRSRGALDPGQARVVLPCLGGPVTFTAAIRSTGGGVVEKISYRDKAGREKLVFGPRPVSSPVVIHASSKVLIIEKIESWSDEFRCHRGKLIRVATSI